MLKKITAACVALLTAAIVSCFAAVPAYADSDSAVKSDKSYSTATSDSPIPDYFGDDKYDTKGNLSLIREEKIIYDSEEMQFIAVTTKDGHVFYILIDYTAIKAAENGEEGADARQTVYFLNKVDDYDLFSLLYDDSDTDINAAYYDRTFAGNDTVSETEQVKEKKTQSNAPFGIPLWVLTIGGVAVFAGVYWFVKIRPNAGKKKLEFEDDDLDFDDEINIDSENENSNSNDTAEEPEMYGSPDDDDLM